MASGSVRPGAAQGGGAKPLPSFFSTRMAAAGIRFYTRVSYLLKNLRESPQNSHTHTHGNPNDNSRTHCSLATFRFPSPQFHFLWHFCLPMCSPSLPSRNVISPSRASIQRIRYTAGWKKNENSNQRWIIWLCAHFQSRHSAEGVLKMREWKMREQIAGVENAGAITRGYPSEEIPWDRLPVVKLKWIGLRQAVNDAHEQR